VFLKIEKHPFDRIGSLVPSKSEGAAFEVQGIAQSTLDMAELSGRALGPFEYSTVAARTVIESYLGMIANREIGTDYLDDILLAHRFRLDIIDGICKESQPREKFCLKHPDDKGDHILVDESFNIVGIIDWEWTRTVSKEEAFSSPCIMWPVGGFYEGSNELSGEEVWFVEIFRERGRNDLADCVMQSRKIQRFYFAFGPDSGAHGDRKTFMDSFAGLRGVFESRNGAWNEKETGG
jgi:hypothetical protein